MAIKVDELRGMADAELNEKLLQLRADLAKERALVASGTKAEKPTKIRIYRRTIARILTLMNEKKLGIGKKAKKKEGQ